MAKKKKFHSKPKAKHKMNYEIKSTEVRVIEGLDENKIYNTKFAISKAKEMELDLVLISERANPPVCKVIDYNKYLYQEKKRKKTQESIVKKVVMKEIRFTPTTGEHDIEFKLKNAKKFLANGNRLKAFVFFRGRAIVHKDLGEVLLLNFAQSLVEYGRVTQMPKLEGKKMIMIIEPNKK